jgi:hypothetical protein
LFARLGKYFRKKVKKPIDKPTESIDGPAKTNPPLLPPQAWCTGFTFRDVMAAGSTFRDVMAAGSTARDEVGLEFAACR